MAGSDGIGRLLLRSLLACLLPAFLAAPFPLSAHDLITTRITWAREISRILGLHCLSCHNPRGTSFPLATYAQARPWAKAIKEEVLTRRMPPWGAVSGFGEFRHDPSLSQEEISLIAAWVEGGAPEGDRSSLPNLGSAAGQNLTTRERIPKPAASLLAGGDWIAPRDLWMVAIQPVGNVANQTKVIAETPLGAWIPLLWLYEYPSTVAPVYEYQRPVYLPRGTRLVIKGSSELSQFRLWCQAPGPELSRPLKAARPGQ